MDTAQHRGNEGDGGNDGGRRREVMAGPCSEVLWVIVLMKGAKRIYLRERQNRQCIGVGDDDLGVEFRNW